MSQPKTSQQTIWSYVLLIIVSSTMGAAITWLIMSQRSTSNLPAMSPAQTAPVAQANQTTTPALPDVSDLPPGEAAITLGNFAYDHQRWPEAIRHYQEAIAKGVDNSDVRTDLGNSFRFSGQPEQALSQYTLAQKLNPQHENSLFNQISLFTEIMNQPQRAVPICEEFIRRFPKSDKVSTVREQLARAKSTAP